MKKILILATMVMLFCITSSAGNFNAAKCKPFFGVWKYNGYQDGGTVNATLKLSSKGTVEYCSLVRASTSGLVVKCKFSQKGTWYYSDGSLYFSWDYSSFNYDPTGTSQMVISYGVLDQFVSAFKSSMMYDYTTCQVNNLTANSFVDGNNQEWTKTESEEVKSSAQSSSTSSKKKSKKRR